MDGKIDIYRTLLVVISLTALLVMPAQAVFPENFDIGENFYTTYGTPNLSASMLGDGEFSRGDTVTVSINLMNKGLITGFKSEKSADPADVLEQKLQQTEMTYEAQRTTAIGVVATLVSLDPNIKVKSGPQEAGTLASGQQTESPVQFILEINNKASAGPYPLLLNLLYGYQENVQINGENETDLGVTDLEVGLWYEVGSQNITMPVFVKEEADFEVTGVSGELRAGEEELLYVTFENTGELPVKDATVRISTADPFSTTDDQAFIGSMEPGSSSQAVFNLKVDNSATIKPYSINSEIKYEDVDGHDKVTDNIKIQVEILPPVSAFEKNKVLLTALVLIFAAVLGGLAYVRLKKSN